MIHKNFTNLNKEHKYTIGEKVKERALDVLVGIYRANKATNKVVALERVLDDVQYIRLSLRLLRDLKVLNEKKYVELLVLCDDVRVQFEKWSAYENRMRKLRQKS
ncbi:MAG: Unknown protein [uncultured Sulfurovum sp.]|uniref:Four helix bundle protein n=1 Tax=uncultured Sulfurovum sp. TaxID=269237 RepID=A0A6S6UG53_9BACT|nr:MAG: Unknown protein [uncultured Sulfurovum sp.]